MCCELEIGPLLALGVPAAEGFLIGQARLENARVVPGAGHYLDAGGDAFCRVA